MSGELNRRCLKCGYSPRVNNIKLFRSPKPGPTNILKCELWAKFCFPDGEWFSTTFQEKLYTEHRMLCDRHFKKSCFINVTEKKLDRQAVPTESYQPSLHFFAAFSLDNIVEEPIPSTSQILQDITNVPKADPQPSLHSDHTYASTPGSSWNVVPEPIPSTSQILQDTTNVPKAHPQKLKSEAEKKLYAKCRKNLKIIWQLRNRIKNMKKKEMLITLNENTSVNNMIKHLKLSFALLLQGQLRNLKRRYKGRRWNIEEKIIALRLYKRSPTCYRLLRKLWCLPAPSTFKCLLGNFKLEVGINEKTLMVLKKYIATHQISDNEFVLMWDEMSIKKHLDYNKKKDIIEGYQDHAGHGRSQQEATHALVFMVAGIRKKVKQPIAFYLSSSYVTADRLAVLIKEVLNKCFEFCISIAATVCDMDGVNRKALSILGASEDEPYFNINNNEIVSMFDPPHLLKCFRNLFLKYNLRCPTNISSDGLKGQGIAKWSHIKEFYDKDNNNPNFVFAPTLRKDHLDPNTKQKMKVNLAAQVLSHSVAAGMYAKVSQGELPSEAVVTAVIINNMDQLFDSLNSDNADRKRGKPFATNLSEASPHIMNHFKTMKIFFTKLEFIKCKNPVSQKGWVWTLNAVETLYYNLKKKHNIRSLATRRLQQDPIENLFGCIRGNCGSNSNPSTGQFIAGLKTAILSNLSHIGKGNCEADTNESIMNNYKDILSTNVSVEQFPDNEITNELIAEIEINYDENIDESSGEIQACVYVCGFLLKKIKTVCPNCTNIFYSGEDDDLVHIFNNFKEYNNIKKSLKYASRAFIICVEHCATIVNNFLNTNGHTKNLKQNVAVACKENVDFTFLETCDEHLVPNLEYIVNSVFYIIVKRFCVLKNRQFSDAATAVKLRNKINILKNA